MGEVYVNFHVIVDANGKLLAWIKAAPATQPGPRVVLSPADPTHVLHENIEIDEGIYDRARLEVALQKALAERLGRRP